MYTGRSTTFGTWAFFIKSATGYVYILRQLKSCVTEVFFFSKHEMHLRDCSLYEFNEGNNVEITGKVRAWEGVPDEESVNIFL